MNMNSSPWKTHSTRQVYENAWITVHEDQVTTPANTPGIYGKISMKNKAIGIIPVDDLGYTWLVGQYRYTIDEYSWEIPMGGGRKDEPVLEAAKRELIEETGLIANKWKKMNRVHTSNSVTDEEGWIFVATQLQQKDARPDETEDLELLRVSIDEAVKMAKDGRITDAISIIGLLQLKDYLS